MEKCWVEDGTQNLTYVKVSTTALDPTIELAPVALEVKYLDDVEPEGPDKAALDQANAECTRPHTTHYSLIDEPTRPMIRWVAGY